MTVDVAVLGGGAAGLMAAIRAAERGAAVTLFERNKRPGVKILASGGGRCNLTTTREGAALLAAFPAPQRAFLKPGFKALPPRRLREWFENRGVALAEEAMEKVFPVAGRASVVLDALLSAARDAGVSIRCGERVQQVVADESGGFTIAASSGEVEARRVILAVGGKSYPKAGTVGDGYAIAESFGLPLTARRPGLVGLLAEDPVLGELAGVTLEEASVRLVEAGGGAVLARWDRPVLFTHKGLSGPGPMNLAGLVAEGGGGRIEIDLVPGETFEGLESSIVDGPKTRTLAASLPRDLPERLRRIVITRAGADPAQTVATLSRGARRGIVRLLKGFAIEVTGTLGWDRAEVTVGGVALEAVDRKTMEALAVPGLYVCGELLDLDGPIGGYNFQAAFATGWLAGEAVGRLSG